MQRHSTFDSPARARLQASDPEPAFTIGQRAHWAGDTRRIGTVKYVGPVGGHPGTWVGVDWDGDGEGKHDGSHDEVKYFEARGPKTASFVRPRNLSAGISLLKALETRYRTASTKEEEDEMYVLSARNKRVSVQLLGKDKIQDKVSRFEELVGMSLSYLGVSSSESPEHVSLTLPNLKELDLTGNLLARWEEVGIICKGLPSLVALNLSNNFMSHDIIAMPRLNNIKILVLNHTGVTWEQVEILKDLLPCIEELHLMGNKIKEITPRSSSVVQGFEFLRLLNLDDNCVAAWDEILKLSWLKSLEQLFLNKNSISRIWYPNYLAKGESGSLGHTLRPFENLHCLLLGSNEIGDPGSIDSLNLFPNSKEIRLSENPMADLGKGGVPRFVLIARLAKVEILNGSEVSPRERKESEIRYIRLVMTKFQDNSEEISRLHPRYAELKKAHGIEDERPSTVASAPQKMGSGLISIALKYVGASLGEKAPLTKKLPSTTTVGKLKNLCESFFKLKSVKPVLFLKEEGSPLPTLLEDDMATLVELGVGNDSAILVDEGSSSSSS